MQTPTHKDDTLTITNGKGRLFIQTLLPATDVSEISMEVIKAPGLFLARVTV